MKMKNYYVLVILICLSIACVFGSNNGNTLDIEDTSSGTSTYKIAYLDAGENIWIMDENGDNRIQVTTDAIPESEGHTDKVEYFLDQIKWSPDGEKLSFIKRELTDKSISGYQHSLYIYSLDNQISQLVLQDVDINGYTWNPDSKHIVFGKNITYDQFFVNIIPPIYELYSINIDNGESTELIQPINDKHLIRPRYSLDGRYLFFEEYVYFEGHVLLRVYDFTESKLIIIDQDLAHRSGNIDISPSGEKLAYDENVYAFASGSHIRFRLMPDGPDTGILPSNQDYWCALPKYSPDGTKVAYLRGLAADSPLGYLWYTTSKEWDTYQVSEEYVSDFTWSPDGQILIYQQQGSDNKCALEYNLASKQTKEYNL